MHSSIDEIGGIILNRQERILNTGTVSREIDEGESFPELESRRVR